MYPLLIASPYRLLRKVDFITYKSDANHRASAVLRRYAIQNPADYGKYNRICGSLRYLPSTQNPTSLQPLQLITPLSF